MSKVTTAPWADTLRGFAMILIIFGHTIGYCSELRELTEYLSSFYVPLFFVVSGYLFINNPNENLITFMKRKAQRILVPYYVFALLSLIPFYLYSGEIQGILASQRDIDNSLFHALFNILYASGHSGGLAQNSPLWFLPCYYTVIVLAKAVTEKIRLERKYTNIVLAFGFLLIGYIVYRFFNYAYPYCLETALIMLFFFFLGRQIRVSHLTLLKSKSIYIGLILLGFIVHFYNGKISCMNNSYGAYFHAFVVAAAFTSVGLLLWFSALKPNKTLSYVGVHTIPFLVLHKMPIVFFQAKMPYISDWLRHGSTSVQLVTATGIVAATILICWIVYQLTVRIVPWIFGEQQKRLTP